MNVRIDLVNHLFLEALIIGEVGPSGAYDKNEMKNAINDKNHAYSRLIKFYCLEDMIMKVFEKDQVSLYKKTQITIHIT